VTTADGALLLAVGTDGQFARLLEVMNDDTLVMRATAWATNAERVADRVALRDALNAVFVTATSAQWESRLAGTGIPFAPILDVAGAFAQEAVATGDLVGVMDSPVGETRTVRSPLRVDGLRPPVRFGPPAFGHDSDALLGRTTAE
jgi:crotonobetainyl-CoA:carnitine CoA-transferase CaiB-like acyl-CoA transferase